MTEWINTDYSAWIADNCPVNSDVLSLDLSDPPVGGIDFTNIKNLYNLQILHLDRNHLFVIPSEIFDLHNLTFLNLSNNYIIDIPSEIGNLCNLQKLYLANNQIITISEDIGNLHNIQEIYLQNNELYTIPLGICNLQTLVYLSLSSNNITLIPSEIGNLHNLIAFYIHNNTIKSLPPEIGNLRTLTDLLISYNELSSLPPEIGNLRTLSDLLMSNNELTSLPPEIGNLTVLKTLDMSNNELTSLPPEIGNLINIESFDVSGNPLNYIPPNVRRLFEENQQGVYQDTQSVHNSTIQQSIKDSIMRLISIPLVISSDKVIVSIIEDTTLTDFTKKSLVEYSQNTDLIIACAQTHVGVIACAQTPVGVIPEGDERLRDIEVNVTFIEVLVVVWNRIVINEHSTDIKNVLNDEMLDAECKCFTGRVSRLVNCLSVFDSLVDIMISDNEQIGHVITVTGNRLKTENRYTVELHKVMSRYILIELGHSEDVVNVWVDCIE